jgi:D-3-phosphoglycerate dehydrogenase
MKDGVRILNFSRADLVVADDLKDALASGKVAKYVTDFPTEESINVPGIVAIPHLGASTPESEDNCAVMAAEQLIDYIENGNIRNSVNYPEIVMNRTESNRVVVLHQNIPNIITQISAALAKDNVNIESLFSQAKGNNAVSFFDTNDAINQVVIDDITAIAGVAKVRAL